MPHPLRSFNSVISVALAAFVLFSMPNVARSADPASPPPLPEAPSPTTGYPTVAAALAGLHARSDIVFSQQHGWTIADDDAAKTIWSFAPPGDAAYPAVVRRQLRNKDGGVYMDMSVQCEASKEACDNLVRAFQKLNAQISTSLHNNH